MPHVVPPAAHPSIEITDDRARLDVTRILALFEETWWAKGFAHHPDLRSVSQFLLLTADKHGFYERLGFQSEREMTMMLRR